MNKGVVSVLSGLMGAALGAGVVSKVTVEEKEKMKSMSDKHLALFLMMNQWVKVKQEGKNLGDYFIKNNYHKIAIYGMSFAGETLMNELKDTEISVAYGIDKNSDTIYSTIDIYSLEDDLEKVDAIVVTAITFFNEIEQRLSEKVECPVISLEDILYEV